MEKRENSCQGRKPLEKNERVSKRFLLRSFLNRFNTGEKRYETVFM